MNFLKNIPAKYLLLLILAVGFLLRTVNLTVGFPVLYSSNDEAVYHLSALNMIAQKTPFTLGNYGPLGAYLQIPFLLISFGVLFLDGTIQSLDQLEFLLVTHEGYFLFIPRMISAMFGTLSIIVAYHLARELFGKREIALFSSLMFAVSFNMVHISHLARPWSGAIFFAMLSTLLALKAVKHVKKYKMFMAYSAICAVVAFGFHQFGGLVIILVGLISFSSKILLGVYTERSECDQNDSRRILLREYIKRTWQAIFIFVILVMLLNFLSLGERILTILNPLEKSDTVELVSVPADPDVVMTNSLKFLKNLFLSDPIIILLASPIFLIKTKMANLGNFKLFILINLIGAMLIFPPKLLRYFLIAFALIPLMAGFSLYKLRLARVGTFFLIVVIAISAFSSIFFTILLLRESTFSQIRNWLDKNISPQTPIITTTYRNLGYVPTAGATLEIRKIKPGYYSRAAKIVSDNYYDNVRNIIHADQLAKRTETMASYIRTALKLYPQTEYIIDSYLRGSDRLIENSEGLDLELIAHFSPTGNIIYQDYIPELLFDSAYALPLSKIDRPGPYFDVLKVKSFKGY